MARVVSGGRSPAKSAMDRWEREIFIATREA
jgi:hypothetical protein